MSSIKFIDFFAGIGGFRLGMERNGHKCVGFCEIDKFARQTYKANFDTEGEWECHDIRTADPFGMPDADCYCFGFPCQAFSVAGRRGGFEDTRGTLFFEVMRLAKVRKPKYLFAENVLGLLSHDGGNTFGTILAALDECGYDAQWQVLNSKDFGVPQNRERVFIVGNIRGTSRPEVFPITKGNGNSLKQLIPGRDAERVYEINGLSRTLISGGGGWGGKTGLYLIGTLERPGINDFSNRVYDGNGIARTLMGSGGNCNDKAGQYLINGRIRRLIPLECFRLQGFPDGHYHNAKKAGVSDSQLYKQAGNSVTVNVIQEIASRLPKGG